MGDTVNFRSHKESYKDKKAVKNSKIGRASCRERVYSYV